MFQLTIGAAWDYVRRALDELSNTRGDQMLTSPDDPDIRKLVEGVIVEAAARIQSLAPALMVDGIQGSNGTDYALSLKDGVITITMLKETNRVASVKVSDSDIIVTEFIPEDSAEGRKQLNRHIRGVADDPRVVLTKKWAGDHKPTLKYYSTESTDLDGIIVEIEYVPYPTIDETIVMICPRLEHAILNEITAMVLDSLTETDRAAFYRNRAKEYMEGK